MAENPKNHGNVDSDPLIDDIVEKLDFATRLDSEPLSFSDLPNEILGEIVGKLDLVSRTRKVSRRLRSVVDKQKAHYDYIGIDTDGDKIRIMFDDIFVDYKNKENVCLIEYGRYDFITGETDRTKQKFMNGNYLEIALNDLEIALKKPKFQLEKLELFLEAGDCANEKIVTFLESLKFPVNLTTLKIDNYADFDVVPILSLLKPGKLKDILLPDDLSMINVNQLFQMEQWKQAKRLEFGGFPIRFEECLHFKRFDIFVESISLQDVIHFRDVLSKSTNFESCRLNVLEGVPVNLEEIGAALGAAVVREDYWETVTHRHPIPGTNEFLDCKVRRDCIFINRKR